MYLPAWNVHVAAPMDLPEASTHAFIVRIWLEEAASEGRKAVWRGQIVHVPSGAQQYVQRLEEVKAFIAPFLEAMGAEPDVCSG